MKKQRAQIAIMLILPLAILLWIQKKGVTLKTLPPKSDVSAPAVQANTESAAAPEAASASTTVQPSTPKQIFQSPRAASLDQMSMILKQALTRGTKYEDVISLLQRSGQDPVVTRSSNSSTGELLIVRTKNPMPGTRYFHGQYFTDEQGERFVQHMSFEFRPGPNSMKEAVQAATQTFGLSAPKEQKGDFVQWDLNDDYVLWIKQKGARDLQDNPFNAYDTKTDVGTVQMTVEMKIHGDGHEGDHH
jgi:hypothetical protein